MFVKETSKLENAICASGTQTNFGYNELTFEIHYSIIMIIVVIIIIISCIINFYHIC